MSGSVPESRSQSQPSHEPWDRFAMKALLVLTAVLILIGYGCARYRIGIDDQVSQCLPPYRWYLIDTFDRQSIKRDQLIAFAASETMAPYFRREQTIIKRVAGIPGDQVSVTAEGTSINGVMQPQSDPALAKALGLSVADFLIDQLAIPEGFLWVMGATRDSFDSRYWRLLPENQVIGRAYALF